MDRRADFFRQFIEEAGCPCDVFQTLAGTRRAPSWEQEQEQIARWIAALPKPAGIMTANDDRGLQVLDACRRIGAAVPEEVAVLGVDNDEYLCGLAIPPLSSIDINSEETGYQAAALLDRMMAGKRPPKRLPQIKPRGVIIRCSTDVLATDDADVVRAVQFIREHACGPITSRQVVDHVSLSRSSLGPRFKRVLGCTIHQEIQRVRVERAKDLLAQTRMPIKEIASVTGFKTVQYLTRAFRRLTRETPAAFRCRQPNHVSDEITPAQETR